MEFKSKFKHTNILRIKINTQNQLLKLQNAKLTKFLFYNELQIKHISHKRPNQNTKKSHFKFHPTSPTSNFNHIDRFYKHSKNIKKT